MNMTKVLVFFASTGQRIRLNRDQKGWWAYVDGDEGQAYLKVTDTESEMYQLGPYIGRIERLD